ncbi:MAG TPA: choice-of-anchor Q domain-containing protein [Leptolyngbyaceae cyanobacterium]
MLISGTASADTLLGLAGDDTIFGWEGNDRILASSGNNIVNGNKGDDTIYGRSGNDLLRGGTGNDILYGDKGDNTVFGDKGDDLIFVGAGNNIINGNEGNDTIYGSSGNDLLRGGKNSDLIFGDAGNDTIYGDWGADTLTGKEGNDIFVIGRTNNAITRTTGGLNRKDSDVITDFEKGRDLISLTGGLSYTDLDIQQGIDIDANNTIIKDKFTGEYLVVLLNHPSSSINESIFIAEQTSFSGFANNISYIDNVENPIDRDTININSLALNELVKLPTNLNTDEDTDLVFNNPNTISERDINLFNFPIKVTLSAKNGKLTLNSTDGLTFNNGNNGSANITFTGNVSSINSAINKFTFTPARNFNGNTSIFVLAEIDSLVGLAANKISSTIPVTVTPVNDDPVNTVPGNQIINENETLIFKGDKAISIADIDAGDNLVQVTLTTNNGTLNLNTTNGLVFNSGNNGDRSMTFSGKIGNVNEALNDLIFTPDPNFTGNSSISIITEDLGNTGGGNLSDRDIINISVLPINRPPVNIVPDPDSKIPITVNPYTVSITLPNSAPIQEGNSSKFTISRDGNFGDLAITLTIDPSSTATSFAGGAFPVDYTLSGGSVTMGNPDRITVTIPDGKSSVDVIITAIKDEHAEAYETLKLNIAKTDNYNINATKNNSTFTIIGGGTVVNSTKDDASLSNYAFVEGTLRQALENATFNWQVEDIITFNLLETSPKITLTGNLRRIGDPLKIDSPTNKLTIDGDNQYQIFDVYNTKASFNNLIVINGKGSRNKAGGIQIQESEVTVDNSIFFNNTSTYRGGAIHNSNSSTLKVTNTTFDNNVSSSFAGGGAISNSGNLTLINSTISNNSAFPFIGGGGGIANNGTITLNNSTIAKNYNDNSGGGIYNTGKVIASHTIIADNNTDSGSSPDFDGTLESKGYNLIGNKDGVNIIGNLTGNILNQSAKLDSLKDNGGLTRTMALLVSSPAINAGDPNFNSPNLLYDQRGVGFDRVLHNRIDIGAFESNFF